MFSPQSLKANQPMVLGMVAVTLFFVMAALLSRQCLFSQWTSDNFLNQLTNVEVQDSTGKVVLRYLPPKSQVKARPVEQKALALTAPNANNAQTNAIGTLNMGFSEPTKVSSGVNRTALTTVLVLFLAWAGTIAVILWLSWQFRQQLQVLMTSVWRLSAGDFGTVIPANQLNGELHQLALLLNDMSARLRRYEDQNIDRLTLERNKLEAVLLSIAEGVLVCDNDGLLVIVNQAAADMLQMADTQRILGQNIAQYIADDGDKPFEDVIQAYQQQQAQPQGQLMPYIRQVEMMGRSFGIILSPIVDREHQSLGFVMIMRDVTREVEVDRMKTQFISNVSHELRTPVTTIKSYVDTLYHHGKELDGDTYQEFLATINTETDRLKRMVNDILDFSRLESPEVRIEMDYQEITPIINLTMQSVKLLADEKHLTVSTALESNLPKVYMNGDSMERVLRNLLSNAIKYTPDNGRIRIKAELVDDGESIMVQVEDTGMGIPEEHLDYIWDRFYRVENEVHTIKGTGLGLHLVKVAIEQHHQGRVFAKSVLGKGSTIGFVVPVHHEINAGTTPVQPAEAPLV